MNTLYTYNKYFDSNIENVCIDYLNNNNKNDLKKCILNIQSSMDKHQKLKKYALKDNEYVFQKLLFNNHLEDIISNFFVEKYIILFKNNNEYESKVFIQKIKTQQVEIDDFDYYFFNFIFSKLNEFIITNKIHIIQNYKNSIIDKNEKIFYKILKKISEKLYNKIDNDNYEDEFMCPISRDIMNEPVKTKYGHTFENVCIKEWIKNEKNCPITRKPLYKNDLKINNDLKNQIDNWKNDNIKYKTLCCDEYINLNDFENHFLKNCCFEEESLLTKFFNFFQRKKTAKHGFNFEIRCSMCKQKLFSHLK